MPLAAVPGTSVELRGTSIWTSDKWGTATWGGARWWGADDWQAVDCQVTDAAITWGSDDDSGVLAQSAAGRIALTTYDPAGLLDPANSGSPWAPLLDEGTPLRVTYLGSSIREGRLRNVEYDRSSQTGRLEGSDAIAELAAAYTPVTFRAVANGLYAFAAEVIAASGSSVPVEAAPGGVDVVIGWPASTADANVWDLIRSAAFDALHLAYVDRTGTLRFAPFGATIASGLVIGDGGVCLEELETGRHSRGLYNAVRDAAGSIVAAPAGTRPSELAVDSRRMPDGVQWGNAVLADRGAGAKTYEPQLIRPADATELEKLAAVRGGDAVRLVLTTAPAIDVTGKALGGSLHAPADGDWSGSLNFYVPPAPWAYVPPTPAAVSGPPFTASALCVADSEAALVWNTATPAHAQATGAGQNPSPVVSGGSATAGSSKFPTRLLLRFDLPLDLFLGGRIYRSCSLRLFPTAIDAGMPQLRVERVVEEWPEGYGATLAEFNQNGVIWPGPARTSSGAVTVNAPSSTGTYFGIDVTAIVRAWIPRTLGGDGLPNFGLMILSTNEATAAAVTWRSRENVSGNPPLLNLQLEA